MNVPMPQMDPSKYFEQIQALHEDDPKSIVKLLDIMARMQYHLLRSLAPTQTFQIIKFSNIPAGVPIGSPPNGVTGYSAVGINGGSVQIERGYNSILVSVLSGTVDMAFGAVGANATAIVNQQPDLQFGTTIVPILIPLPQREDRVLSLWADASATSVTSGTVILQQY